MVEKLVAARARLILDHPFLGAITMRLPLQAVDEKWCRTTATDARNFYFNPDYIDALAGSQIEFVLAHEALHCALGHFHRRQHRAKHRWDLACDFAINPLLIGEGLRPPPGVVPLAQFEGMSAESIYPCLDDLENEETFDDHLYDAESNAADGSGTRQSQMDSTSDHDESVGKPPSALTESDRETLAHQWQRHVVGAAQQARDAGKLGGAMARVIEGVLQPALPWRVLLARHLQSTGREDYSYSRPSRREGEAILPSRRSHQIDLLVALDISGSISSAEINQFVSELNAIKSQVSARITCQACDSQLASTGPWTAESWEPLALPDTLTGGGGTDFRPIFSWSETAGQTPDLLIYFTDGMGTFPELPPPYPTLWLLKGGAQVPWGETIRLN
jgi:predicted metal-dependent peptidase